MPIGPKTTLELRQYTQTRDAYGGFSETWMGKRLLTGVLKTITQFSDRETVQRDAQTVPVTHIFQVRKPVDETITEKDILVINKDKRQFEIKHVGNPAEQNRWLVLKLLETNWMLD